MKKQFCDKRDGKKYVYVQIGEQIWMAENLNYAVCGSKCGIAGGFGYGSLTDSFAENCDKYGRLYNWDAALTVCPDGWHLPSDTEWTALTDYVGNNMAGTKLKATSDWNCEVFYISPVVIENAKLKVASGIIYDGSGTDDYGFSALPGGGGYSSSGGRGDSFSSYDCAGIWWSATEDSINSAYAYNRAIRYNFSSVERNSFRDGDKKANFLSVRCVKDSPQADP